MTYTFDEQLHIYTSKCVGDHCPVCPWYPYCNNQNRKKLK